MIEEENEDSVYVSENCQNVEYCAKDQTQTLQKLCTRLKSNRVSIGLTTERSPRRVFSVNASESKYILSLESPEYFVTTPDQPVESFECVGFSRKLNKAGVFQVSEMDHWALEQIDPVPKQPQTPVSTNEILKGHYEKLIEDLQGCVLTSNQDVAILKVRCHESETELRKSKEIISSLKERSSTTDTNNQDLRQKNEHLESEVNKLKMELKSMELKFKNIFEAKSSLHLQLDKTIKSKEVEINELQQLTGKLKTQCQTRLKKEQNLKDEISCNEEEILSLKKQVSKLTNSKSEEISRHEFELKKLQNNLTDEMQQKLSLCIELENVKKEVENLTGERDKIVLQLKSVSGEKEELKNELCKSEAGKVVQEVQHSAVLKKTIHDIETSFEKKMATLEFEKLGEIEKLTHRQETEIKQLKKNCSEIASRLVKKINHVEQEKTLMLRTFSEKLARHKAKIDEMKASRSQVLSKFQDHLQKQWRETVQLLYSPPGSEDSDDEIDLDTIMTAGITEIQDGYCESLNSSYKVPQKMNKISPEHVPHLVSDQDNNNSIKESPSLENTALLDFRSEKLKLYINKLLESTIEPKTSMQEACTDVPEKDN